MFKFPTVSVIIPTKNEASNIAHAIDSVLKQTYKNIEVIVVDNNSTDSTREIAGQYTRKVFIHGDERSTQRNYGAKKAKGEYLLFLDSDMILSPTVIEDCIRQVRNHKLRSKKKLLGGIIIPEESFGEGFWAKCKKLERSFYLGVEWIEAARFYNKKVFEEVSGYDEEMISGEDWDLSIKVKKKYVITRVNSYIYHNEGRLSLYQTLMKKFYYSKKINSYRSKNISTIDLKKQTSIFTRYQLYLATPKKLLKDPVVGLGMLVMKTAEFSVGAMGILVVALMGNSEEKS